MPDRLQLDRIPKPVPESRDRQIAVDTGAIEPVVDDRLHASSDRLEQSGDDWEFVSSTMCQARPENVTA